MPQRHVLKTHLEVPAEHAGQPADRLGRDGVALVRHGAAALLALRETFADLAHLGALQVPELHGDHLERGAGARARPQVLRVAVTCDHLRGGHGRQPEARGHAGLDGGRDVRVRADSAGQLAHRHRLPGRPHARAVAVHLQRPQSDLRPESRRLGVDAVRAPDHRGAGVLACRCDERAQELGLGGDHQVRRVAQCPAQSGVDHVGAGEPVVDPRTGGRTDSGLHHVNERRDVVVGDGLALLDSPDERGIDHRCGRTAGGGVRGIDHALRGQFLRDYELDLQPAGHLGLLAEQRVDLG